MKSLNATQKVVSQPGAASAHLPKRERNAIRREDRRPQRAQTNRSNVTPTAPPVSLPFFGRVDWLAFALSAGLVLAAYLLTLAPNVTLEDSGEMSVAAQYAGVPHAPGYPVWTLYSWVFTKILPFSNIAWRVAVGSAVAGALACGLVGLMVSRGARLLFAGHSALNEVEERWQRTISIVTGTVAGTLLGLTGFVWSQAVIVEVYTLSLLSLTSMMACLFRWMYVPHQRRYLYVAWFLFGICLNNHQSLVVAALAIEVCIAFAAPRLGRDLLLGNVLCYLAGLFAIGQGWILQDNRPLLAVYNVIGLGSIAGMVWLAFKTRGLGQQFISALFCGASFLGGAVFYLWMPITSMSNPPMNWAYPRTVAGFFHALTRGQYESPHPVTSISQYAHQLWHLGASAADEFSLGYLVIGLLPLLLLRHFARRERGWLTGGLAFYLTLGPGLLLLLNPGTDRGTQNLVRVFFGASHVMLAMSVGFGAALALAFLLHQFQTVKRWAWGLCALWLVCQFSDVLFTAARTSLAWSRWAAIAGFALAVGAAALVALASTRCRFVPIGLCAIIALLPLPSALSHWWSNEQSGHLFGFWFGHDMFTPPFSNSQGALSYNQEARAQAMAGPGAPAYPEMARNAILFGGTDPGRFCPTYMIFSESFLPPEKRLNPEFDRRDVYVITQNALADGHYLEYIRAHYNRSAQEDPYFFSEFLRGKAERADNTSTNFLARLALPLDNTFTAIGTHLERNRRAAGLYPAQELSLPTNADLDRAMQNFMMDFQERARRGQLRPGEEVRVKGNQAQVTGQAAVMGINAILTREIFEKNPGHEFYVEESFPIDWMYPHLTPFGTIMKLERRPPSELTPEVVERDRRFWSAYMERLMGDWVKPETNISEICEFADRVHLRQDLTGYKGDRKFIRDEQAQKAFSKLRSSIGGIYDWRFRNATGQLQVVTQQLSQAGLNRSAIEALQNEQRRLSAEQVRMFQEAEFAYKQAYALSPLSPEAMQRLVNLLLAAGKLSEATAIAEMSTKLDPRNAFYTNVAEQLHRMQRSAG
ncbi:MAG TPA: DUF2723 domain-containing protein [Verrucomicrobiae bacterium]|nr:DUF2723 domain-containing protein [Verrucomicrobiae bacterium]